MNEVSLGALHGLRVLDTTTNYCAYAGRLLSDLGAEVIRVEPPGGSAVRRLAPRSADGVSFAHAFLEAGKKSVVINMDSPDGMELFNDLVGSATVLIQTPCVDAKTIPSVERLRRLNPNLIVASITPFGLSGPCAHFPAGDLTVLAAGGLLSLGGYPDSEPIAIQGQQSELAGGIFAAVAILATLCSRPRDPRGLWIDVSEQECVAFALEDAVPDWYLGKRVRNRAGDRPREAGTGIFSCRDGFISMVAGRLGTVRAFASLIQWLNEEATEGAETLLLPQWTDFAYRRTPEAIALFSEIFGTFCRNRTKAELYREGQARRIAIAPVNTVADLFREPQLRANAFFRELPEPELGTVVSYPGPPYKLSRTPASVTSGAPHLGQHDLVILQRMGRGQRQC
ncbi:MAG: CaiB/BaiF CoA transferase family protein [Steroidobacteraceae bacterium]